jgi:hypothetical protein
MSFIGMSMTMVKLSRHPAIAELISKNTVYSMASVSPNGKGVVQGKLVLGVG